MSWFSWLVKPFSSSRAADPLVSQVAEMGLAAVPFAARLMDPANGVATAPASDLPAPEDEAGRDTVGDPCGAELHHDILNPASGLPMLGDELGLDVAGNPYGLDLQQDALAGLGDDIGGDPLGSDLIDNDWSADDSACDLSNHDDLWSGSSFDDGF